MTKVLGSETWPSPFPLNNEQRLLLNPARIRCARETAGLSKVQLAQLLSVDPRTITNYEKDGAPQTKIKALSEILKVMPSFFTVHPSDPAIGDLSETQVWFRSMRKSTARQRKSAVGHGKSALLLFHWIENHFNLPCNDLPMEDIAQMPPRSSALALRGDWGYGENPLPNMVSLAESHGIRVFSLPSMGKEVDAFSFVFAGQPYIAVDTHKTPERVRFDISHEIGHLVMHEASMSELDAGTRDIEKEAHDFASNLLMPECRVKSLIPHHALVSDIFKAKKYFGVAAMAMAYRAHALGRLTDWEYRSMCSQLTSMGYRTAEPEGISAEKSQVFDFVVNTNRTKGISVNTVSEETGLTSQELHGLSFGNFMTVTSGSGRTTGGIVVNKPKLVLHVNKNFPVGE